MRLSFLVALSVAAIALAYVSLLLVIIPSAEQVYSQTSNGHHPAEGHDASNAKHSDAVSSDSDLELPTFEWRPRTRKLLLQKNKHGDSHSRKGKKDATTTSNTADTKSTDAASTAVEGRDLDAFEHGILLAVREWSDEDLMEAVARAMASSNEGGLAKRHRHGKGRGKGGKRRGKAGKGKKGKKGKKGGRKGKHGHRHGGKDEKAVPVDSGSPPIVQQDPVVASPPDAAPSTDSAPPTAVSGGGDDAAPPTAE
ncbi:hypothetical protein H0H92_002698 [Tricholoma furcatifolium]|nr:hypothetical protein H0H92_002698 [Tricholoma furcatifolium]